MLKKHLYAIAFISWMVFITFSSLYSFEGDDFSSFNIPYGDKLVHFTFYFVAAVFGFLYLSEANNKQKPDNKIMGILLISLIFFGIIIEVIQEKLTMNRAGDVFDAMANSIGAFCGIVCILALFYWQRRLK
ncbi:MAG: VanZ family protein [Maribacter sp.]